MLEENKYITHEVLNTRERKMYRYIDERDGELKDLFHNLDKKLDLDRQRGEQTIEQQGKMISSLDRINDNLIKFDKRVTKVEDQSNAHERNINNIIKVSEEKKAGSVQITVAIITTLGTVLVGAFGVAHIFF
ncbi:MULTISPECIES: hypothetical protein [Staphylococcus]|uniref:Uncharacterized protein n=1 Tax=Staphylococcus edaphicus TaxID=1955013 RepID=A0A2C6WRU9_9STAP|nr:MULTISPECIES: hypothetical protein [Staphylococcus]PHK50805.1 hypothetical protein BTJ66_00430 [Staphylococcus edaphicus]PTI22572.1 hypothetical protein BU115_08845 [Staphylococcus xylosus]UQW82500.1 hypothetical protein MNY58_05395 [Staphylococcus edaphicus]